MASADPNGELNGLWVNFLAITILIIILLLKVIKWVLFAIAPERRNLLWMLFTDPDTRALFDSWEDQALQLLSHFRRDFVRATQEPDIRTLIKDLEKASPDFKTWWREQDIHGFHHGWRRLCIESLGCVSFEYTELTIDEERHLRLVYYASLDNCDEGRRFEEWLKSVAGAETSTP